MTALVLLPLRPRDSRSWERSEFSTLAARRGKVDLAQALDLLGKTTFRRKDELLAALLRKHRHEG